MSRSRDADRSLPAEVEPTGPTGPTGPGAPSDPALPAPVAGVIVGGAQARSGEDTRRRGWFWHWNAIVTQYAPLVGLKGVGLLNSYTVWTDRREESPHRGYAFPSQQSEADFYGEDRAELITINKILVALDLIEIRKEMVLRVDEAGRRWRVPHNLYRVKDRDDGFSLTAGAVDRVVQLADRDRAVYRYIRHIFSPKFRPIDANNVWTGILETARQSPTWIKLADRAAHEDAKASARTKAGHRSRKAAGGEEGRHGGLQLQKVDRQSGAQAVNDSGAVESKQRVRTSVATTNNGSRVDVAPANTGLDAAIASDVAPANEAGPSAVAPANTTYHQEETTTTTRERESEKGPEPGAGQISFGPGGQAAPADQAGQEAALRAFHDANQRAATLAERKLLRDLAERFEPAARESGMPGRESGWQWVTAAIFDAVDAGSAFVATRRVREILSRWEREGLPGEAGVKRAKRTSGRETRGPARGQATGVERGRERPPAVHAAADSRPLAMPSFIFPEAGLSNAQVWQAVLDDLLQEGRVGRANIEAWLRPSALIGRGDGGRVIVGAPNTLARRRVADRFAPAIAGCLLGLLGIACDVEVVVAQEWLRAHRGTSEGEATEASA